MGYFTAAAIGFRPIIRGGGGPFSVTQYAKPATDVNVIANFDMVQRVPGGVPLPDQPNYNVPTIQCGSTGTPGTTLWLGPALGFGAASKLTMHAIPDEVDCVFLSGSNDTAFLVTTAAHIGKNANIHNPSYNIPNGKTKMSVDVITTAANAALDVRLRSVSMIAPNLEGTLYTQIEVTINKHFYGQATPGI